MAIIEQNSISDSYMQMIRRFPLRRIASEAQHREATRRVMELAKSKVDKGARQYLDVLVDLIADYERRAGQGVDLSDLSAADLVRHRLEERKQSVSALAREIGVPQSNLSEMISGKRGWSKTAIRALSELLNIRAERFLD